MKKAFFLSVFMGLLLNACSDSQSTDVIQDSGRDGKGGSLATFTLKGDYLYVVDSQNLSVFNISTIETPVKVNSVPVGFDIETLFPFNDYLFIGSGSAMYIYDISNAELPKQLSRSDHFRSCDPVVANDNYAFVTLHTNNTCFGTLNELQTYDITDVENPKLLNTRSLTEPKGLSLYGNNYLLVCDDTVKIFDVQNPTDSKFVAEIPVSSALDIIIIDDTAFIISDDGIDQYQLNEGNIENYEKISSFSF